jgi:hypothetical protein
MVAMDASTNSEHIQVINATLNRDRLRDLQI